MVGALIVVAALAILHEAYLGFLSPKEIDLPYKGLVVSSVATLLNAGWSWVLVRQGHRHRSAALASDGKHLLADVVTSFGVVGGVILVVVTGKLVLDAVIAALVALHVLWSGWEVIRDNTSGLMDEAAPPEELARIREMISVNAEGAIEAHALKTRHAGTATFIDFHLVVSRAMPTGDAHDICDRIERALRDEISGAVISIHVEPEDKAKHGGIPVVG